MTTGRDYLQSILASMATLQDAPDSVLNDPEVITALQEADKDCEFLADLVEDKKGELAS